MVVTDVQVRTLRSWLVKEASLTLSAAKAGMDRKTARKYRFTDQLPSRRQAEAPPRDWRTSDDPFAKLSGRADEEGQGETGAGGGLREGRAGGTPGHGGQAPACQTGL